MAEQPGSNPVASIDTVGSPSVGTAESGKVIGSKWQMAIAAPVRNRKFEFGTVINYKMAADPFGRTGYENPDAQMGITHLTRDHKTLPSALVQYGDKALLGPSTDTAYENYRESIRILAVQDNWTDNLTGRQEWDSGVLFSLDRKNKYKFNVGDPVSIYATGRASAWTIRDNRMMTAGITKGYKALNTHGAYTAIGTNHISEAEDSVATNFIMLQIKLPSHGTYDASLDGGLRGGPAIFFSNYGLGPWRDVRLGDTYGNVSYPQDNSWDWKYANIAEGKFRYIYKYNSANNFLGAYAADNDPAGYALGADSYASIVTGFYHPGGEFKDTAQALFTRVDNNSPMTGGLTKYSIGVFRQYITLAEDDRGDLSYNPIISGTYYRLGLTWKGSLAPGGANSTGDYDSALWAKFQWGPLLANQDLNHAQSAMISTPPLLSSSNIEQADWAHNMVSGFVDAAQVDYLGDPDNIKIEVVQTAASPNSYAGSSRKGRGTEILSFIDNIWLEHEGDIPGASGKGYVELDHFPELGTLTVRTVKSDSITDLNLSDGSLKTIDPTGNMFKERYVIEGDFLRVSETVYNQLRRLLQWQARGHKLTLHPFLPEVPHCLVGKLQMEEVTKNHWDLTRFNFRFRFEETE